MKNLIFLFLFICTYTYSQSDSNTLIQLSGVIVSSDSLDNLPFTTVFHKGSKRGTVSDYYGYFSIVVMPGDTLLFKNFGFKISSYIVPDTLKDDRYSIIHVMIDEAKLLPTAIVYPWPSKENFAKAFLEMHPYDDALRRAQKQLSGSSLAFIAAGVSTDPGLTYSWQQNQQYTKIYTMGQSPVNNLFNPSSWNTFINSWKSGKLARE
jgi:signal peptidase I